MIILNIRELLGLEDFYKYFLFGSSQKPFNIDEKHGLRKIKSLAQGHTTSSGEAGLEPKLMPSISGTFALCHATSCKDTLKSEERGSLV